MRQNEAGGISTTDREKENSNGDDIEKQTDRPCSEDGSVICSDVVTLVQIPI